MSDTTTRLRADLVVGGLWEGAPVATTDAHPPGVAVHFDGEWARVAWGVDGEAISRPRGLLLVLDDPLGLGLAGLAARVVCRSLPDSEPNPGDGADACSDWVAHQPWFPIDDNGTRLNIATASTYLALTDRLCAAVGLTLAPGDVARWDLEHRTLDQTGEDVCSWGLTTAGGRWGIDLIGQPDWQAALEAAIAEVTRA